MFNALQIRSKIIKRVGKEEKQREHEDRCLLVSHTLWKRSVEVSENPDTTFRADDAVRLI